MKIGVVGVHCNTTPLDFREAFIKSMGFLQKDPFSFVVVSTCNRVEIYFSGPDLVKIQSALLACIQNIFPLEYLYSYFSKDCFAHLAKVASGLDSAILLESDIQRQVKVAYELSRKPLPKDLHYAFQKALHISKTLRRSFGKTSSSLESALWDLCFKEKKEPLLFIGFSQTNRQIFAYFQKKWEGEMAFSSRRKEVEVFCRKKKAIIEPWMDLDSYARYPVWIVATATKKQISFVKKETARCIIDLSVPRVISPTAKMEGVSLFNIEDLDRVFQKRKKQEHKKKSLYEELVKQHAGRLFNLYEEKALLERSMPRKSWERNRIADIFHAGNQLQKTLKSNAKSAMGARSVLSEF